MRLWRWKRRDGGCGDCGRPVARYARCVWCRAREAAGQMRRRHQKARA